MDRSGSFFPVQRPLSGADAWLEALLGEWEAGV